jgi:hypothetical protein
VPLLQNPKKAAARRGYPIHGYVGSNGGGKSAAMVWDTLPTLAAGKPVLGTVRLLDYENPRDCDDDLCASDPLSGHFVKSMPEPAAVREAFSIILDARGRSEYLANAGTIVGVHRAAHPLWIPLVDWQQVLDGRWVDLLLDEVTGAASSRDSMSLPSAVANKLVQLRRADITVRWSSPAWARADKIIRECSSAVTYCTGMMKKTASDEGGARSWRQARLFKWKTYDANDFEDFTAGKRQEMSALVVDWHWGPKSPAFRAYDTYDAVLAVGTVTESGTCYRCGGSRPRPRCTCKEHRHDSGESAAQSGGAPRAGYRDGLLTTELAEIPSSVP